MRGNVAELRRGLVGAQQTLKENAQQFGLPEHFKHSAEPKPIEPVRLVDTEVDEEKFRAVEFKDAATASNLIVDWRIQNQANVDEEWPADTFFADMELVLGVTSKAADQDAQLKDTASRTDARHPTPDLDIFEIDIGEFGEQAPWYASEQSTTGTLAETNFDTRVVMARIEEMQALARDTLSRCNDLGLDKVKNLSPFSEIVQAALKLLLQRLWESVSANKLFQAQCEEAVRCFEQSFRSDILSAVKTRMGVLKQLMGNGALKALCEASHAWTTRKRLHQLATDVWLVWSEVPTPNIGALPKDHFAADFQDIVNDLKSLDTYLDTIVILPDGKFVNYTDALLNAFSRNSSLFEYARLPCPTQEDLEKILHPLKSRAWFLNSGPDVDTLLLDSVSQQANAFVELNGKLDEVYEKIQKLLTRILNNDPGSSVVGKIRRHTVTVRKSFAPSTADLQGKINESRHREYAAKAVQVLQTARHDIVRSIESLAALRGRLNSVLLEEVEHFSESQFLDHMPERVFSSISHFMKTTSIEIAQKLEHSLTSACGRPLLCLLFLEWWQHSNQAAATDSTLVNTCFCCWRDLDELASKAFVPNLKPLLDARGRMIEIHGKMVGESPDATKARKEDTKYLQPPGFQMPADPLTLVGSDDIDATISRLKPGLLQLGNYSRSVCGVAASRVLLTTLRASTMIEALFQAQSSEQPNQRVRALSDTESERRRSQAKNRLSKAFAGMVRQNREANKPAIVDCQATLPSLGKLDSRGFQRAMNSISFAMIHHINQFALSFAETEKAAKALILRVDAASDSDREKDAHEYQQQYTELLRHALPTLTAEAKALSGRRRHSMCFLEYWVESDACASGDSHLTRLASKVFAEYLNFERQLDRDFVPHCRPLSLLWQHLLQRCQLVHISRPFLDVPAKFPVLRMDSVKRAGFHFEQNDADGKDSRPWEVAAAATDKWIEADDRGWWNVDQQFVGRGVLARSSFEDNVVDTFCGELTQSVKDVVKQCKQTLFETPHRHLLTLTLTENTVHMTEAIHEFGTANRELMTKFLKLTSDFAMDLREKTRSALETLHLTGATFTPAQEEALTTLNITFHHLNSTLPLSKVLINECLAKKNSLMLPPLGTLNGSSDERMQQTTRLFVLLRALDEDVTERTRPCLSWLKQLHDHKVKLLREARLWYAVAGVKPHEEDELEFTLPSLENAFWRAREKQLPTREFFESHLQRYVKSSGKRAYDSEDDHDPYHLDSDRESHGVYVAKQRNLAVVVPDNSLLMERTPVSFERSLNALDGRLREALTIIDRWIEQDTGMLDNPVHSAAIAEAQQQQKKKSKENGLVDTEQSKIETDLTADNASDGSASDDDLDEPPANTNGAADAVASSSNAAPAPAHTAPRRYTLRKQDLSLKQLKTLQKHRAKLERIRTTIASAWERVFVLIRSIRRAQVTFDEACKSVMRHLSHTVVGFKTNVFRLLSDAVAIGGDSALAGVISSGAKIRVGTLLAQSFIDYWKNNNDARMLTEAREIYQKLRAIDQRVMQDVFPDLRPLLLFRRFVINAKYFLSCDNSGASRVIDLRLEPLWFPPQIRFNFLPLPPEMLSLTPPPSYVAQQKYSRESAEIVQLRVQRQFEIAKNWITQFEDLLHPKSVVGIPPATFNKLSDDIEAAFDAFRREMFEYIRVNTEFAADCGEAIKQFEAEWGTQKQSPTVEQRLAFKKLLEYFKVLSGDRMLRVAKVGNAFMSSTQFTKNQANFHLVSEQFATDFVVAWADLRDSAKLGTKFQESLVVTRAMVVGTILATARSLGINADIPNNNDPQELLDKVLPEAVETFHVLHKQCVDSLREVVDRVTATVQQVIDQFGSYIPFSLAYLGFWNQLSTVRRERIGRDKLLKIFDKLVELDNYAGSQVTISLDYLQELWTMLNTCGQPKASPGGIDFDVLWSDIDPDCAQSKAGTHIEGSPFHIQIPSASNLQPFPVIGLGASLPAPLSREGLMVADVNKRAPSPGPSRESLAAKKYAPEAIMLFLNSVAALIEEVLSDLRGLGIESKDLVGLKSSLKTSQLLLAGIVERVGFACRQIEHQCKPVEYQFFPDLVALAQVIRRLTIQKHRWSHQHDSLMQVQIVLQDIESRLAVDVATSVDLDKFRFVRLTINDTVEDSTLHLPKLPSEEDTALFGKCKWSIQSLHEVRQQAQRYGVVVRQIAPLLSEDKQHALLTRAKSEIDEMVAHVRTMRQIQDELNALCKTIDETLTLQEERLLEHAKTLMSRAVEKFTSMAAVSNPNSPFCQLLQAAEQAVGKRRKYFALTFATALRDAGIKPTDAHKQIFDKLLVIDDLISANCTPHVVPLLNLRASLVQEHKVGPHKLKGAASNDELSQVELIVDEIPREQIVWDNVKSANPQPQPVDRSKNNTGMLAALDFAQDAVRRFVDNVTSLVRGVVESSASVLEAAEHAKIGAALAECTTEFAASAKALASAMRPLTQPCDETRAELENEIGVACTNMYSIGKKQVATINNEIFALVKQAIRLHNTLALTKPQSRAFAAVWKQCAEHYAADRVPTDAFNKLAELDGIVFDSLMPQLDEAQQQLDRVQEYGVQVQFWSTVLISPDLSPSMEQLTAEAELPKLEFTLRSVHDAPPSRVPLDTLEDVILERWSQVAACIPEPAVQPTRLQDIPELFPWSKTLATIKDRQFKGAAGRVRLGLELAQTDADTNTFSLLVRIFSADRLQLRDTSKPVYVVVRLGWQTLHTQSVDDTKVVFLSAHDDLNLPLRFTFTPTERAMLSVECFEEQGLAADRCIGRVAVSLDEIMGLRATVDDVVQTVDKSKVDTFEEFSEQLVERVDKDAVFCRLLLGTVLDYRTEVPQLKVVVEGELEHLREVAGRPAYSRAENDRKLAWQAVLSATEQLLEDLLDIERVAEAIYDPEDHDSLQQRFENLVLTQAVGLMGYSRFLGASAYVLNVYVPLRLGADGGDLYYSHWSSPSVTIFLEQLTSEVHAALKPLGDVAEVMSLEVSNALDRVCGDVNRLGEIQRKFVHDCGVLVDDINAGQRLSFSMAFGQFWSTTQHLYDWGRDMVSDNARFRRTRLDLLRGNLLTNNTKSLEIMIEGTTVLAGSVPYLREKQRFVNDMRLDISTTVESMFAALQACDRAIAEQFVPVMTALQHVQRTLLKHADGFDDVAVPPALFSLEQPRILSVESFLNSFVRAPHELQISVGSGVSDYARALMAGLITKDTIPVFDQTARKKITEHKATPIANRLSLDSVVDAIFCDGVKENALASLVTSSFGEEFIQTQRRNAKTALLVDYPHLKKNYIEQTRQHFVQVLDAILQPGTETFLPEKIDPQSSTLTVEAESMPTCVEDIAEWWPVGEVSPTEDLRGSALVSPVPEAVWPAAADAIRELRLQLRAVSNPRKTLSQATFNPALLLMALLKRYGDDIVLNDKIRDSEFVAPLLSTVPENPLVEALIESVQSQKFLIASVSYKLQEMDYETVRSLFEPLLNAVTAEAAKRFSPPPIDNPTKAKLVQLANATVHALELFDYIHSPEQVSLARIFRSTVELLRCGVNAATIISGIVGLGETLKDDDDAAGADGADAGPFDLEFKVHLLVDIVGIVVELADASNGLASKRFLGQLLGIIKKHLDEAQDFGGDELVARLNKLFSQCENAMNAGVRASDIAQHSDPSQLLSDALASFAEHVSALRACVAKSDVAGCLDQAVAILLGVLDLEPAHGFVLLHELAKFVMWVVDLVDKFNDSSEFEFVGMDAGELEILILQTPLHHNVVLEISQQCLSMVLGEKASTALQEYLQVRSFGSPADSSFSWQQLMNELMKLMQSNCYETELDLTPVHSALNHPSVKFVGTDEEAQSAQHRMRAGHYAILGQLLRFNVDVESDDDVAKEAALSSLRLLGTLVELFGNIIGSPGFREPDLVASFHLALAAAFHPHVERMTTFTIGNEPHIKEEDAGNAATASKEASNSDPNLKSLRLAQASAVLFHMLRAGQQLRSFVASVGARNIVSSIVHYSTLTYLMDTHPTTKMWGFFGELPEKFFTFEDGTSPFSEFVDVYLDPPGMEFTCELLKQAELAENVGGLIKSGEIAEAVEDLVAIVCELAKRYQFLKQPAIAEINQLLGAQYPVAAVYANACFDIFDLRLFFGNTLASCIPFRPEDDRDDQKKLKLKRMAQECLGLRLPTIGSWVTPESEVRLEADPAAIKSFVQRCTAPFKRHNLMSFELVKVEHFEAMKDELMSKEKQLAFAPHGGFNGALFPVVMERVAEYAQNDTQEDVEKILSCFVLPVFTRLFEFASVYAPGIDLQPELARANSIAICQWEAVLKDVIRQASSQQEAQFRILDCDSVIWKTDQMVTLAMRETTTLAQTLREDTPKLAACARVLAQAIIRRKWFIRGDVIVPEDSFECMARFAKMADPNAALFLSEPVRFASAVEFMDHIGKTTVHALAAKAPKRQPKDVVCAQVWRQVSPQLLHNVDIFFDDGFYLPGFFNDAFQELLLKIVGVGVRLFVIKGYNLGKAAAEQ